MSDAPPGDGTCRTRLRSCLMDAPCRPPRTAAQAASGPDGNGTGLMHRPCLTYDDASGVPREVSQRSSSVSSPLF